MPATVDTDLAQFETSDLLREIKKLTHRIHRATEEDSGESAAILRELRSAAEAEIVRRVEKAERALVAVEVAERIMDLADETLTTVDVVSGEGAVSIAQARTLLDVGQERMTTATCTLVKDQALSDRISKAASAEMRKIKVVATLPDRT